MNQENSLESLTPLPLLESLESLEKDESLIFPVGSPRVTPNEESGLGFKTDKFIPEV